MTRQPKPRAKGAPKASRKASSKDPSKGRKGPAAVTAAAAAELSPARIREILEERARRLARAPEVARRREDRLTAVAFTLSGERYAIEARYVREAVRFVHFAAVPDTPDFLVGVTNLRGTILAVVDLGKFFGLARRGLSELSRVLVLGEERAEFGVLADTADGLDEIDLGDIREPTGEVAGIGRDFVRGTVGDALVILDGAALLGDARLYVDQHGATGP